jgi:hypothetical protein
MKIIIITLSFIFSFENLAHLSKEHDNLFGWGKSEKKQVVKVKKRIIKKPRRIVKRKIIRRPIQKSIVQPRQFQRVKTVRSALNYMPETIAKPGECYATAYIKNDCSDIEKRVIIKDSYLEREIIPAVTKLIKERVLMRKALIVEEVVPPLYEIIENKVLIQAAHTQWKKGSFTATQKTIGGDTYCLVEVPAKYRIEKRKILRIKGSIIKKEIPAVYKVFDRVVVVKEESVKTKRIVPQRYEKVKQCLSLGGYYEWISILCNENATENVLIKIEKNLNQKGLLNQSFVDGIIDNDTEIALRQYQKSKSLKVSGLLTIETVESLGIRY